MQAEAIEKTELAHQDRVQILVQLDHVKARAAGQQARGDGALTGTDLDQMIGFTRTDRANDAVDHAGVVQEVLTKALARLVLGKLTHTALRALIIWMAVSRATCRLPGLAWPVPARSRAVP